MSDPTLSLDVQTIHWPSVIRHYRLSKGLKQAAMAHDLGVTQTMISRWESGVAIPSEGVQERVFDLYWASQTSVSRSAWLDRIGRHPAVVGVINGEGRILRASRGFCRSLDCQRLELEGRYIHEAFEGDWPRLFDALVAAGLFEGRLASAESIDVITFLSPDGERRPGYVHGLHRPSFLPGPEILWLLSGADVSERVHADVKARLGGAMVLRKAI
ncbi:helix-turn-helix domain-containing protein [uncultured Maricaulis sp.]|uniref:helix-turn-helix domain-containing protein n=1 Tax=uncultured Maricaulis sp. TaxID=174710 RepID=UPI0026299D28|nr:helix-turn-helix domain-containing protein [uncultured Maricaulis sp.]